MVGWNFQRFIYMIEEVHPLHTISQERVKLYSFVSKTVSGVGDTGGNSEDSVVCHLVCPPALLL